MKPLRVLLVEDHALVRAGIRSLLERMRDVDVVAEAGDGREALRMVRAHRPDIVMTDVAMKGMNGMEATARISKDYPATRVIILSMYTNEEYVLQAWRAGAQGYLIKGAAPSELEVAIQAVARGETYLSPAVSRAVIDDYVSRSEPAEDPLARLTPRQREILQLIVEGRSTRDMARELNVSAKTVETHRTQLMDRLGIHDVAGLVRYAIRVGLISPHD